MHYIPEFLVAQMSMLQMFIGEVFVGRMRSVAFLNYTNFIARRLSFVL